MSQREVLDKFGDRVGYSPTDKAEFREGDPRLRHMEGLAEAAPLFSILAEVVKARHCSSGYQVGDRFVLDVDGNFITKLCPKKLCIYAISQMVLPVALICERLGEGLDPNAFHFGHQVRCPDVGVECAGYGEVMFKLSVVPRG